MSAYNEVRFRIKPGQEQRFIDFHKAARPRFKGFLGGALVRTGEGTYCFVAEWRNFKSIVAARPEMIAMLDQVRDALEDLGSGLGVTDPVSGEVVAKLRVAKARAKAKVARAKVARARVARKAASTKARSRSRAR